ncbi:UNVERIFIED_CONTAM: AAA family ATPase [Campylobacter lari]
MNIILNKLVINGAKNINKDIELVFTNKSIKDNIDKEPKTIKAIYGPNGSGKSGLISAVYIYKRILTNNNSLSDNEFKMFLMNIINKKTNKLKVEAIFTAFKINDDKDINITENNLNKKSKNNKYFTYKHEIIISKNYDDIFIESESLSELKNKTINDSNFKALIKIKNGQVIFLKSISDEHIKNTEFYKETLNLLNKNSFINILTTSLALTKLNQKKEKDFILPILTTMIFSYSINIFLNNDDKHKQSALSQNLITDFLSLNETDKIDEKSLEYLFKLNYLETDFDDYVNIRDFDKLYLENIKNLEDFIRLFKPDLVKIDIDYKQDGKYYRCRKLFNYGDYNIDVEFESAGIKKLVRLYNTLKMCADTGYITFIDEIDANLHDVYLTKLIEYLKDNSNGQLCFTTHNLSSINVLKDRSYSLDFLSNDSRLYSWTKNGNNSPHKQYVNGLIDYSPFNIESFHFDILKS